MHIYRGFATGLEILNQSILSDRMIRTPVGRGYRIDDQVYADEVHIRCLGEENEHHTALFKKFHRQAAQRQDHVYVGAAGFLNLSYIAVTKPSAAILFDINILQTLFWRDVIKALAENRDPKGFRNFMAHNQREMPQRVKKIFNEMSYADSFTDVCDRNSIYRAFWKEPVGPWLDAAFEPVNMKLGEHFRMVDRLWMARGYGHLHTLAKNDAIGALTLDVCDRAACNQLKDFLDHVTYRRVPADVADDPDNKSGRMGRRARIKTLYISNIFRFLGKTRDWTGRYTDSMTPERARENLSQLLVSRRPQIIHERCGRGLTWPQQVVPNHP